MTVNFVHRLVERTRADRPALRPVVGPWSPAAAEPLHAIEVEREVDQPAARPAEPDAAPDPRAAPQVAVVPAAIASRQTGAREPREPAPARPTALPILVPSQDPRAEPAAALHAPDGAPAISAAELAASSHASDAAAAPHARDATAATTGAAPATTAETRAIARTGAVATRPVAATARGDRGAREPSAEAAPVIRVHIGRVDVRAASPPAPVAKRAADPLPSVALGRYLDARERRR